MLTTEGIGAKSPYREAYRTATEVRVCRSMLAISPETLQGIPVHRQCFPIRERFPAVTQGLFTTRSIDVSYYFVIETPLDLKTLKPVPLHSKCFPTAWRTANTERATIPKANHGSVPPTPPETGIHPLSTSLLSSSIFPDARMDPSFTLLSLPSISPSPPAPSTPHASLSLAPSGGKSYIRNSRKIRGQTGSIYGWFESEDTNSLAKPPSIKEVIPNDLFIHKPLSGEVQIWLWTTEGVWRPIKVGELHPFLPTHCLIINNGKPRWVTRQTVATYACRGKTVRFKPELTST